MSIVKEDLRLVPASMVSSLAENKSTMQHISLPEMKAFFMRAKITVKKRSGIVDNHCDELSK
jgi:hypothetical protein